ncbi:MAG: DUF5672 family protein [Terrimicrobiaceae bacterium]
MGGGFICKMIKLPNTTLLIFNPAHGANISAKIISFVCSKMHFGDVVHMADTPPTIQLAGRHINVPRVDWEEGQRWQAYELGKYFDTQFMLHIETDGFPFNFHHWDDDFLNYDYIGAPWPPHCLRFGQHNVGNGGCSIQSKKFRDVLWENRNFYIKGLPSDVFFGMPEIIKQCQLADIKFPPMETAIRFSYENPIPEFPDWKYEKSFAFHGKFPSCLPMIQKALYD